MQDTQVTYTHKNFFFLSKPKNCAIPAVQVNTVVGTQSGDVITLVLTANQLAPFTFLETPLKGRFSDNGFLLLPDTPVT